MTTLNVLAEAAKIVEYDEDGNEKIPTEGTISVAHWKPSLDTKKCRPGGYNSRENHNKLEKSRRAELKNFFQKLKQQIPRLKDKGKASNVSILIEATNYINELKEQDKEYENERMRLHRCRLCLEERIKMLKIDIQRTYLQNHLFAHVEEEKKKTKPPLKEMTSVEIQANEDEIQAENLPVVFPRDQAVRWIVKSDATSLETISEADVISPNELSIADEVSLTKLRYMVQQLQEGGENVVIEEKIEEECDSITPVDGSQPGTTIILCEGDTEGKQYIITEDDQLKICEEN